MEAFQFLKEWDKFVDGTFLSGWLESITGRPKIGVHPVNQFIDIEQALAKSILSLDWHLALMEDDRIDSAFLQLSELWIQIILLFILGSPENDDLITKVQNSRPQRAPSITRVFHKLNSHRHSLGNEFEGAHRKDLNGLGQSPVEVGPLRIKAHHGSIIPQPCELENEDRTAESVDWSVVELLLETQLNNIEPEELAGSELPQTEIGGDITAGSSRTEDERLMADTSSPDDQIVTRTPPDLELRPSEIGLPTVHSDPEEEDFIPPPWAASPALKKFLKAQSKRGSLRKKLFGSPDKMMDCTECVSSKQDQLFGPITLPSPDPNAPYELYSDQNTDPESDVNDSLLTMQSHVHAGTDNNSREGNMSSTAREEQPSLPISSWFRQFTPESPCPPGRNDSSTNISTEPSSRTQLHNPKSHSGKVSKSIVRKLAKLGQIGLAAPPRGPFPRACRSAAPSKGTLFTGKARRRPKKSGRSKPQTIQLHHIDDSAAHLAPDEKLRRAVKLTFKTWYSPVSEYISFGPTNKSREVYRKFSPYEVPLSKDSAMTREKKENVEAIMREMMGKITLTTATRPDNISLDSIYALAAQPGQCVADVRRELKKQIDQAKDYKHVLKFLTFSVVIVDLSTASVEQYQATYKGLSPTDKQFLRLVSLLHALCCRLDHRWAGHHLSLVGHLLSKDVGITILGDLFTASQPMAFNELLQYLNGCLLTPSGSGMTAVDYVKIILRGAEDASDKMITDALTSVPEAPIELSAPAKHAQDLYASLMNGECGNLGSLSTGNSQTMHQKRYLDSTHSDQHQSAKRQRLPPQDSGYCDEENTSGPGTISDLCRDVELFVAEVRNHRLTTSGSTVRPFEVSCNSEDILQLGANAQLSENLANTIVGLLADSAIDDTVYFGTEIFKYIHARDFQKAKSQVEGIPIKGRWFLLICCGSHYETVRINWDEGYISFYDPRSRYVPPACYPPLQHQTRQQQILVTNLIEEWTQYLCEKNTCRNWTKNWLHGPWQENGDTENCLLFNIWGLSYWLSGREFDGIMGDPIKYKRTFLELIRSHGQWARLSLI